MQAGMGDTVFTPLYDVLRSRGVRFRFFHQVTRLGVSDDGRLGLVDHGSAAGVADAEFAMTRSSGWAAFAAGRASPSGISSSTARDCRRAASISRTSAIRSALIAFDLRVGEDFDEVVLGISVGALPEICGELAHANARFKQMLDDSDTVMTEGIQLWLAKAASQLGWGFESSIATSYVNVADTYSNMSQLLAREKWRGPSRPEETVYLCGVIDHRGVRSQEDADARVRVKRARVPHAARRARVAGGVRRRRLV